MGRNRCLVAFQQYTLFFCIVVLPLPSSTALYITITKDCTLYIKSQLQEIVYSSVRIFVCSYVRLFICSYVRISSVCSYILCMFVYYSYIRILFVYYSYIRTCIAALVHGFNQSTFNQNDRSLQ